MKYFKLFTLITLCAVAAASGCRRAAVSEAPGADPITLNVTSWTERTELFIEYPPLVAKESARFAVHLTTLNDFKALNAGHPTVEMTPEGGGAQLSFRGSEPLRPGAFRVDMIPPTPGRYRWALKVEAPGVTDRHDLGAVTVYPDAATAAKSVTEPAEDATAFAYLKEQQWTNEFATAKVVETEVRASLRLPASIEALTGGEAVVSAPAAGRFAGDSLPAIGTMVRNGQILGHIEPRGGAMSNRATLAAEVAEAQATLEAARIDQERAERLLVERAVPARRVEDAKRATAVAEARLDAARSRLEQRDETLQSGGGAGGGNAFALRTPLSGRLTRVDATLGASYEEGAPLFTVTRTDRVELRAQVPSNDASRVRDVESLIFAAPGAPDETPLKPQHMHDSGVLDPQTRALAVQFEVDNPDGRLLIGQHGTVTMLLRNRTKMPVVPRAAVLTEAGRPFVFVQVGGESFTRRQIEIAAREGDLVGVSSGLKPGDRVVTRGAYEVQLASAAKGLPAEGHVH